MKNDALYWRKLDSVGAVYASLSTNRYPNVNRFTAKLKEKIIKEKLEMALYHTLKLIPSFNVKLRRGLFWYYLENNPDKPTVWDDASFPIHPINHLENNYFLFRVSYYEKRIHLDLSHILTDGVGGIFFLETLVSNYLKINIEEENIKKLITKSENISMGEMDLDGFNHYYRMKLQKKKERVTKPARAYQIKAKTVPRSEMKIIEGCMSIKALKDIVREKHVTVTCYLTALLIYSLYHGDYKKKPRVEPITICIPVNLRSYFTSKSIKNFFTIIPISVPVNEREYSFDEILDRVSHSFNKALDKELLLRQFKYSTAFYRSLQLRIIPLFVKDILVKCVSAFVNKNVYTMTLSNVGLVDMGEEVEKHIDKIIVTGNIEKDSPLKATVCSVGDNLTFTFTSIMKESSVERYFFTFLSSLGVKVRIAANTNLQK